MSDLIELARNRNRLRKAVVDWMNEQGALGNLPSNSDAPMWNDYSAAEDALRQAIAEVGE